MYKKTVKHNVESTFNETHFVARYNLTNNLVTFSKTNFQILNRLSRHETFFRILNSSALFLRLKTKKKFGKLQKQFIIVKYFLPIFSNRLEYHEGQHTIHTTCWVIRR